MLNIKLIFKFRIYCIEICSYFSTNCVSLVVILGEVFCKSSTCRQVVVIMKSLSSSRMSPFKLWSVITGLFFYLMIGLVFAGEAEDKDSAERQVVRSRVLNLVFGVFTFSLIAFAVIGILLILSMIGINVFKKMPRISPQPTSRYESF